ncbi:FUSC family protein [Candidatus Methanoprimaticola sp. MG2]|uniref:FUSC family protein n=1 Tax=Candidatus Methanoprimaticola sp. MG2 TaxID=3228838 RepID=UPI0039C705C8
MNAKTVAGKTVFFLLLCLFVGVFSSVFGAENSLVGVMIIVLALMMMQKDLSVRPGRNLIVLLGSTLSLGVGAFVSLYDPLLGAVVNFTLVFLTAYLTMNDVSTPMHFPFLLGYAFMLSVPVTPEQLPMRILALAVGSVFIVGMNWVFNRKTREKTSHNGLIAICREIDSLIQTRLGGEVPDPSTLDSLCDNLGAKMYERLKDRFYSSPRDNTLLELVSCLRGLGRKVCTEDPDKGVLKELSDIMGAVISFELGDSDLDSLHSSCKGILSGGVRADRDTVTLVRMIDSKLAHLSTIDDGDSYSEDPVPKAFRYKTLLKENLRGDSLSFSFAFRIAGLFTLWAFIWQYWDVENAKWLLYTTIAVVMPYIEGSWKKASMRITGTLVGALAFIALAVVLKEDMMLMTAALLVINYIYTVLDPKRYDVMMSFITVSALIAASMAEPAETALLERIAFILLGVAAATIANHTVLPYRMRDENMELGARFIRISSLRIGELADAAAGNPDLQKRAYLTLTAGSISQKLFVNARRTDGTEDDEFVMNQSTVMSECALISASLDEEPSDVRRRITEVLHGDAVTDDDVEIVKRAGNLISLNDRSRRLLGDMATADIV